MKGRLSPVGRDGGGDASPGNRCVNLRKTSQVTGDMVIGDKQTGKERALNT